MAVPRRWSSSGASARLAGCYPGRHSGRGGLQKRYEPMNGARISRPPVHRISVVQLAVLLALWGALARWNALAAMSFALGGLVAIIPNAYFAVGVFRWRGARVAQRAARAGFAAEIGKFLLSIAGFALVFGLVRPIEGWAVFAGYGAMLLLQVIGAWWLLRATVPGKP